MSVTQSVFTASSTPPQKIDSLDDQDLAGWRMTKMTEVVSSTRQGGAVSFSYEFFFEEKVAQALVDASAGTAYIRNKKRILYNGQRGFALDTGEEVKIPDDQLD